MLATGSENGSARALGGGPPNESGQHRDLLLDIFKMRPGGLIEVEKRSRSSPVEGEGREGVLRAISRSQQGHGGKYESRAWHADTASVVQFIISIVF